jgi:hypothetical protein
MKEKILAALKTKYTNLGFGEKAFAGVAEYLATTVTEENQIETAIAGVEPLLKSFQGDIDKRVNDAVAKTKAELEKKPDTAAEAAAKAAAEAAAKAAGELPQWAKEMQAKLEAYEKKESQAALSQRLRDKLKEKGVTESFLKRMSLTVESESDIDKLAGEIEADFVATKQELINKGLVSETPKRASEADEKAEIDNYLKEKFPEEKK